ncbi:LexA family protein [Arenimonas caeni]|nr:XRE family transcriptional regulator [Arenimonas caeni]
MNRQKTFGQVIRQLRKQKRLTQEQLAEQSGVDQGAISRVENGRYLTPESLLEPLAAGLGVRPSEILAAVENAGESIREQRADYAVAMPSGLQAVPLIGWVQAGKWNQVENPFDPDVAEGIVYTVNKVGRRSYALKVKGDSMTNPRGWPTFPPGTTIIVDPTKGATSGDLVVAQIDDEAEATFKKLAEDGGRKLLVPLNPQYPTLQIDQATTICGVVVAIAERSVTDRN